MAAAKDKRKVKASSKNKSGPPKPKPISKNPGAALSLLARARRGR